MSADPYLDLRVGELLDSVAHRGGPGAGAVAAIGAAWAAAKLVEVNLAMRDDDPRLAKARAIAAGVTETARIALTTDR